MFFHRLKQALTRVALAAVVSGGMLSVRAEDKKAPAPIEPPKVIVTVPLGLIAGRTNALILRGLRLKESTNVVLLGLPQPSAAIVRKREDAKPPDGQTATSAGDQQLAVELWVPTEAAGRTNLVWQVLGPGGAGESVPVSVFLPGALIESHEPNNGFLEAQGLKFGQTVRGTLEKSGEVDVFRVEAIAGEMLHAEIRANRIGSTLDAILTLYDARGAILASNDDAFGRDPALSQTVAVTGPVFVVVTYANEKAASTHSYLLAVTVEAGK
jgi:hypothetical protein